MPKSGRVKLHGLKQIFLLIPLTPALKEITAWLADQVEVLEGCLQRDNEQRETAAVEFNNGDEAQTFYVCRSKF
tara:strand:- start:89 stop:310 length:222 start_codon:yes stop_codon:yes gene_type:complete